MATRIMATVMALLCASPAWAQDAVPVIRAHSKVVTITDGLHVKKNYWYAMPEKRPDVYFVEIPLEPHTVTFTTDVESIQVSVSYGSQHEFVIRFDDGVEARTQVRAVFRSLLSYRRTGPGPSGGVDTIPFTLGGNDKIYVKGRINGGPVLDFQFDLGAGGSVIKKASVAKVQMQFDGTVRLRNSDGDNVVPSSSANRLEVAGLAWDAVPFVVADNMTRREDALIGNALFQDKVLEIDYDRMVIAIHDTLPALSPEWIKQTMILDGVVPYVRGALEVNDSRRDGWFLLDTGAYTSILNSERLSASSKVVSEMWNLLSGRHRGPALWIAGRVFGKPNYSVGPYSGDRSALGLLGNDVLKRFNLIVDNRRGFAYFRPNQHLDESFRNPEYYLVRFLALTTLALGVAVAWLVRRERHSLRE
jgi:hypothetical protein